MSPKKQEQHHTFESAYPTSPWTEAYQAASDRWARFDQPAGENQSMDQAETQQPTQDALSVIYNWGY